MRVNGVTPVVKVFETVNRYRVVCCPRGGLAEFTSCWFLLGDSYFGIGATRIGI